jgi:hypothetical protein
MAPFLPLNDLRWIDACLSRFVTEVEPTRNGFITMKRSMEPTIWQKKYQKIEFLQDFCMFSRKKMRPSRNPKSVSWAPRLQVAADPHLRSLQKLGYVVKYQGVWSLWNSNITINLYTHNHHYDLIWNLKTMVGISNIRRRQRVPTSPHYSIWCV